MHGSLLPKYRGAAPIQWAIMKGEKETGLTTFALEEKVDTGKRKFGTVLGDKVKTGIGTLIYPGRKIWPQKTTLPGEIVKEDIL